MCNTYLSKEYRNIMSHIFSNVENIFFLNLSIVHHLHDRYIIIIQFIPINVSTLITLITLI